MWRVGQKVPVAFSTHENGISNEVDLRGILSKKDPDISSMADGKRPLSDDPRRVVSSLPHRCIKRLKDSYRMDYNTYRRYVANYDVTQHPCTLEMRDLTDADSDEPGQSIDTDGLTRRSVLRSAGVGVAGVTLLSGTASATRFQFYGCSQVCTDTSGGHAVVAIDGRYECRSLSGERDKNRQNQEWKYASKCYEVSDGEAIVGILRSYEATESCKFCVNPNNCASNYYDKVKSIVDELNESETCGKCGREGDITAGTCDTTGTGGGRESAPRGDNGPKRRKSRGKRRGPPHRNKR